MEILEKVKKISAACFARGVLFIRFFEIENNFARYARVVICVASLSDMTSLLPNLLVKKIRQDYTSSRRKVSKKSPKFILKKPWTPWLV